MERKQIILLSLIAVGLMLCATGTLSAATTARLQHYWDFEDIDPANYTALDPNDPNTFTPILDTANNYTQGLLKPAADLRPQQGFNKPLAGLYDVGHGGGKAMHIQQYSGAYITNPIPYIDPADPNRTVTYDPNVVPLTNFGTSWTFECWMQVNSVGTGGWNRVIGFDASQPLSMQTGNNLLNVMTGGVKDPNDTTFDPNAYPGGINDPNSPYRRCTLSQSSPPHTWTASTWYHLAIVANAADGSFKVYRNADGTPLTLDLQNDNDPNSPTYNPYRSAFGGYGFFLGELSSHWKYEGITLWDDVALWDGALDEATLTDHMLNGYDLTPGTPTDPNVHHLPGDANLDGIVDSQDFTLLKASFGTTTGATWGMGDFNGDGIVDSQDFTILKAHFGESNSSVVPEPTTMVLLALGGAALLRRRGSSK